jgi:hypothetical protein
LSSPKPTPPGPPSAAEPGDSNQDGRFDQHDIVAVLQAGKYLAAEPATWSQGDWNGDGRFSQADIVAAMQSGNYLGGAQAARTDSAPSRAISDTAALPVDDYFAELARR